LVVGQSATTATSSITSVALITIGTRMSTSRTSNKLGLSQFVVFRVSLAIVLLLIVAGCEDTSVTTGTTTLGSMPDLVGINFKEATELFKGTSFDNRVLYEDLLEDRTVFRQKNWIVVSQEPDTGSSLTGEIKICLGIVKTSEEPTLTQSQRNLTCSIHTSYWEQLAAEESAQPATQGNPAAELTPLEEHLLALGLKTTDRHPHIYYKQATGVDDICEDLPCWKFVIVVTRGTCPTSMYLQMVYWNKERQTVDYARSDDVYPFTGLPVTVTVYDKHFGDQTLRAGVHSIHCS